MFGEPTRKAKMFSGIMELTAADRQCGATGGLRLGVSELSVVFFGWRQPT